MQNKSFIKVLLERRIPQILGSYFIAGTSLIFFIQYLVDKYQFPSRISIKDLKSKTESQIEISDIELFPKFDMKIFIPEDLKRPQGVLFKSSRINIFHHRNRRGTLS